MMDDWAHPRAARAITVIVALIALWFVLNWVNEATIECGPESNGGFCPEKP